MKQFSTSFLIVPWLDLCGGVSVLLLVLRNRVTCNTFLVLGLEVFRKKQRDLVLIGMAALCWALWISRNDLVFQKSQYKSILQVIFRGTFWIRSWSVLSKQDGRAILKDGCHALEAMALEECS
jgi:hypothetical protein